MKTTLTCPSSGQEFVPKRSNQRFFDGKSRNKYYNDIAKNERDKRNPIVKALKLNHQLLTRILGDKNTAKCSRDYLLGGGFTFTHLTSVMTVEGKQVAIVYDMAYKKDEDGSYKIVRI
mgnify:CR=1 FL=1|jgi:hypothetical protein|tara:strand:+ start:2688 stop:3041 length:354 start_codon:yes stop_codon:yes gene_type:complete